MFTSLHSLVQIIEELTKNTMMLEMLDFDVKNVNIYTRSTLFHPSGNNAVK